LHLTAVPVVDGSAFVGMVHLADLGDLHRRHWESTTVGAVARTREPVAHLTWTLGQALATMEAADTDRLPVVDGDDYVGIITIGEILKLDEVLDMTEAPPP
jgi:CBS domain-containing protein